MDHNASSSGNVFDRILEMAKSRHILIGPAASKVISENMRLCVAGFVGLLVLRFFVNLAISHFRKPQLPVVNKQPWDLFQIKSKLAYHANGRKIMLEAFDKYGGPFLLVNDWSEMIVMPPEYIDDINKEPNLSHVGFVRNYHLSQYTTFEPFKLAHPGMLAEVVTKSLTKNLPKFTMELSEQMDRCLKRTWGESSEWHEVNLRDDVLDWVARLSNRIFLGPILCEHKEWLRLSIDYTISMFTAIAIVKLFPKPLRWLAERLLPICRQVRSDRRLAMEIIKPILAERKAEIALAKKEGREPVVPDDSIEWHRRSRKFTGPFDDADAQLGLGMAGIHTTSDFLGQCVLNLCKYPEVVEPLRAEAVQVLSRFGWQKVALTEVRLLDSFMKETQRLKPISFTNTHRVAVKDVVLPGGLQVRKGMTVGVMALSHWRSDVYENPDTFDFRRFVKRREAYEHQNNALFVSTSRDYMAFGHGKNACPGRFFAGNETKIALLHLLLKYDFAIEDPKQAEFFEIAGSMLVNPSAKIKIKRRQEEIDLAQLKGGGGGGKA